MDRELLYNQSGIKDVTAYKAIKNLGNGGTKEMNGCEINKGEIWEVMGANGTQYAVVINVFERYASVVILQEQEPQQNAVQIRVRDIMYVDAGRVRYVFDNKFVDFVRMLAEEEERELRVAIGAALELPIDKAPLERLLADANREIEGKQYEISELQHALENSKDEAETLRMAIQNMTVSTQGTDSAEILEDCRLREDLAAARREAEIYKGLYEAMLERALG